MVHRLLQSLIWLSERLGPMILIGMLAGCSASAPDFVFNEPIIPIGNGNCAMAPATTAAPQWRRGEADLSPPVWPEQSFSLNLSAVGPTSGASATAFSYDQSIFSTAYVARLGYDVAETFTAPAHWDAGDWLLAGGVAAGVGTTMAFDRDIQKAVQRNHSRTASRLLNDIQPLGAEYSAGVLAAFYLGGEVLKDPRAKAVAMDGISVSLIASGLIDLPLKYAVGRSRPQQGHGSSRYVPFDGDDSFPSGHATQAFAVATVIAEHYDSPWIKVTSYGLASAVAYARVNGSYHWTSDVVAGAAIGIFAGEMVVRLHRDDRVSLSPLLDRDLKGLQLTWNY